MAPTSSAKSPTFQRSKLWSFLLQCYSCFDLSVVSFQQQHFDFLTCSWVISHFELWCFSLDISNFNYGILCVTFSYLNSLKFLYVALEMPQAGKKATFHWSKTVFRNDLDFVENVKAVCCRLLEGKFCFFKWANPGLFLFIFILSTWHKSI